jgi:AbrB family looped-hinge helix DNA binding protein
MSVDYIKVHDERGRIVIPQKIREALGIVSGTLLEVRTEPVIISGAPLESMILITKVK